MCADLDCNLSYSSPYFAQICSERYIVLKRLREKNGIPTAPYELIQIAVCASLGFLTRVKPTEAEEKRAYNFYSAQLKTAPGNLVQLLRNNLERQVEVWRESMTRV